MPNTLLIQNSKNKQAKALFFVSLHDIKCWQIRVKHLIIIIFPSKVCQPNFTVLKSYPHLNLTEHLYFGNLSHIPGRICLIKVIL